MNELIGRKIDQYRIDALLGEGGMGTVYRAFDLNLARPVALKVMHSQLARQKEFQQRFLQEARSAARLNDHPSIVTIHHFGESQGMLYMVMALVTGGSLSAHVQRLQTSGEAIQLREVLVLMGQVADALGYAHRNGVVHRDIKPSNVLIQRLETPDREGDPPLRAVVTDFGLAKILEGGVETRSGDLMGTYAYMSPEQCLRKDLDGRSDIYSLGVMLYQLTTGKLPFDIQSATDAVMKHLNEIPPAPRVAWAGLPPMVEVIILKAIAKKPEERFEKAETMALAMREASRKITESEMTKFTGQRTILSLETQLQQAESLPEPSRMGFDLSPIPSQDQLVIAQKDRTPRSIALDKQQLTIGRSAESDLTLDHVDVSRQHARLEHSSSGWQVTDLNSTNGTYLDGNRLLAGVPEPFHPGKTLRIGPYFLHWRGAEMQTGTSPSIRHDATHLQSSTGQIAVNVHPTTVEVSPGSRVEVQVELFNQGLLVDHFKLRVLDVPSTWATLPQTEVDLMPGATATVVIHFNPPPDSSARAGSYSYRLMVGSQAAPGESVIVPGQLAVKPFEGFSAEMQPSRLQSTETTRVAIRNNGNVEGTFSVTGRDPANEVLFGGEQARIRVPAGEVATRAISVKARNRPWLGSTRTLPFEVLVKMSAGAQKGLLGQLEVKPRIPAWVLPLVGILLALCLLIGGFGISARNRSVAQATQTAVQATQTAEAAVAMIVAGEGTRASLQTQESQGTRVAAEVAAQTAAVQATSAALTAIALGDDDGDGLSNAKEAELGTSPTNPDTDQDGLTDGQEVNEFGTDPKKNDTDGDNLLDGAEVNQYHTNPTKPDTDGDGLLDGVEVAEGSDPMLPPSATPTPSATPMPTSTRTPTPTTPAPPPTTPAIVPTQSWSHSATMVGSRDTYSLRLDAPGLIRMRVNWGGTQGNLALIINGPGQTGYYARVDGTSPLEVSYNVTASDFASGDHWRVTIASFGDGRADGMVQIDYPNGNSQASFNEQFAVVKDSTSSISLIVVSEPGPINAQASWVGSAPSLALIINGPGQVGYYARQDGSSPLSVSYMVTPGDLTAGFTWRVSLTSFSATDATAQINLTYP